MFAELDKKIEIVCGNLEFASKYLEFDYNYDETIYFEDIEEYKQLFMMVVDKTSDIASKQELFERIGKLVFINSEFGEA